MRASLLNGLALGCWPEAAERMHALSQLHAAEVGRPLPWSLSGISVNRSLKLIRSRMLASASIRASIRVVEGV